MNLVQVCKLQQEIKGQGSAELVKVMSSLRYRYAVSVIGEGRVVMQVTGKQTRCSRCSLWD